MSLINTFKEISRLNQIVNVLFKNELHLIIDKLKLRKHLPVSKQLNIRIHPTSEIARRLRLSMEELSGTFTKLGQLLSLRSDLLPKTYTEEFSKLQDNVKPFKFEYVRKVIEEEFQKPLEHVFVTFEKEPIASASVGQVHKATLNDGKIVAVKVQRPNIDKIFEIDIQLFYHFASLLETNYPELKDYNFVQIVKEFEEYTKNELDYMYEARNIDIFYNNFRTDPIKIPKVYWSYTTKRVLTMEYIEGKKITDVKLNRKTYVKQIVESYIKQTMEYGVFHADPHPGNIFVTPDQKLALLDFGIVGHISDEIKENFENLFISIIDKDKDLLTSTLLKLRIVDEEINEGQLKEDVSLHLGKYYNIELNKMDISLVLYDILSLIRKYKMKMPTNFVLLIKATITVEGFGKEMYPDFNLVKICKPYLNKLKEKKSSYDYMFGNFKKNMLRARNDLINFPEELKKILKRDKVKVDIEDADIRKFTFYLDNAMNRMAMGIILAGLLVSSALIAQAKIPPLIYDLSLFSIIFIMVAIIISFALIKSINEEKRR
jgi:ubiquinone biosynthesis protein